MATSSKKSEKKSDNSAISQIFIESYGVKIKIETNLNLDFEEIKIKLEKNLPNEFNLTNGGDFAHSFFITKIGSIFELYKHETSEDEKVSEKVTESETLEVIIENLISRVRITIAEFAEGKVFLHAGVVAVGGLGIVIPARSFQGKTTLVAELVKNGAVYYSDEYAVLDEKGCVHPFPKMLSMRGIIDDYTQLDVPVEDFGGVAGTKAVPVAMVLITEYKRNAIWKPKRLSAGQGIMEILPHTLPIRNKPEFTLNVLNIVAERAIITKTKRAEANQTVRLLMSLFEKTLLKFNSIHQKDEFRRRKDD